MAAYMVIATAGHVDHGKTALVKALTGNDTDTTAEEKRRGLTIQLGFTYMDLPHHRRAGIVDVPGHERFIKNMVAGMPGIQLVLLAIDIHEGVMPQTREHIHIVSLLGIRHILVVLTKVETMDAKLRQLAAAEIRNELSQTEAAGAEIIETDAVTGYGIPALRQYIQGAAEQLADVPETGSGRLHADRVFSVKGFGTVVTGTLLDGPMHVGDDVYLYPGRRKLRIRSIQIHEEAAAKALPGQRTALNLPGIAKEDIQRGDVLCTADVLEGTRMLDVYIQCLADSPVSISLWSRVRLLIGTEEVIGRAVPLGTAEIKPGQTGFLQLRLEGKDVFVNVRDRFILRTFSPMQTIAGGEVLDIHPKKHRRFHPDVVQRLRRLQEGGAEAAVTDFLCRKHTPFASMAEIAAQLQLPNDVCTAAVASLLKQRQLWHTPAGCIHRTAYKTWQAKVLQILWAYHRKYPLRAGMPCCELKARMGQWLLETEAAAMIQLLLQRRVCRRAGHVIAASQFQVTFTKKEKKICQAIRTILQQKGCQGVKKADLFQLGNEAPAVVDALHNQDLLFLTDEYVISRKVYQNAVHRICRYIAAQRQIKLSDCRDFLQTNRNAALRILECMDRQHITKRQDAYRILDRRGLQMLGETKSHE
mgnify:FL=1